MFKYYVTTDQTADFPHELTKDEFKIIPMTYVVDGVLYDGVTNSFLKPDEFYALLEQGKMSTTSMVPVSEAQAFFENILKDGFDILHLSFASALSGCYEGYLQAAENLKVKYPERKIIVVDSKCAASGEGLLAYYVLKKRDEGASLEENAEYALELRDHIGHIFTVDNMMHLYRGGRISKNAAYIASAIQIKPVLTVNEDGALVPMGKVIGRKKALHAMADKTYARGKNYSNDIIIISHCDCASDALMLKEMVLDHYGREQRIIITDVGPVIGSHLGKGGLTLISLTSHKKP